jgi:IS5 family transposase
MVVGCRDLRLTAALIGSGPSTLTRHAAVPQSVEECAQAIARRQVEPVLVARSQRARVRSAEREQHRNDVGPVQGVNLRGECPEDGRRIRTAHGEQDHLRVGSSLLMRARSMASRRPQLAEQHVPPL